MNISGCIVKHQEKIVPVSLSWPGATLMSTGDSSRRIALENPFGNNVREI